MIQLFLSMFNTQNHRMSQQLRKTIKIRPNRSKMIQNGPKSQNYVKKSFKKCVYDIKINKNHGKLSFSMVYIDFDM